MKIWNLKMLPEDFSYLHFYFDKKELCIGVWGYLIGVEFK